MQTDERDITPNVRQQAAKDKEVDWNAIVSKINETISMAKQHFMLFFALLFVMCVLLFFYYALAKPVYTASAVIGPPNPSPLNAMISTMGGPTNSIAKRLIGGASGGSNNSFEEFKQLFQTSRLITALVEQDKILPLVFYPQWDKQNNRWYGPGAIGSFKLAVMRTLQRPAVAYPNAEALEKFLDTNFAIAEAKDTGSSSLVLAPRNSDYLILSLNADDRSTAERLLSIILHRADELIRQEQLNDVNARISYIESELRNISQAEQKDALIEILASQEEIKVMMVADKRFSYVQVSSPHASLVPTKPVRPTKAFSFVFMMSLVLWGGLVMLATVSPAVRKAIGIFAVRRRNGT
jgi:hypothetical protein